jgi:glycosyltransferase 2 family protein
VVGTPSTGSAMKRWGIRAAGSVVVLGLLFWFLPREAIADGFMRVPATLFPVVVGFFLLGHAVTAAKWWWLIDRGIPFTTALQAHFAGLAANLCLPGAAGGDAVRAGFAQLQMRDGAKVAAGAVADRLIDTLGLACLSLIGLAMLHGQGGGAGQAAQATVIVLVAMGIAVFAFPQVIVRLWTAFPKLPARGLALRTAEAFASLGRRPGLLIVTLLVSMAVQALFIWLAIQLAEAVGVNVPLGAWLFAWPLAKIIAVLPISLGGLGVREASLAALMVPFGADAAQVVASGLVWQAVLYVSGAIGAVVLALSGVRLRRDISVQKTSIPK